MKNAYTRMLATPTPQSEPENDRQVKNNAGGYTFTVDAKARLERFLILGTDGGTYYVNERDLTKQNVDWLIKLIKENPYLVAETTVSVSAEGRAPKNSAAIFVMALLFTHAKEEYKPTLRRYLSTVARTSTHLYEWAGYIELLGGWGPAKRKAVIEWYENKSADNLAYQAVKYRQRNGWSHRDLFRLAHPTSVDSSVRDFVLGKDHSDLDDLRIIDGFRTIQKAENVKAVVDALDFWKMLPWEAIPTQFLREPEVWKKLFYNGQLNGQALVRNITRLARINAFADMVFAADYAARLADEQMIAKTRLHPINYLNALVVHEDGQVRRTADRFGYTSMGLRSKDWTTNPVIRDALNEGFHLAFKHVEPSNKRTFIGLDVSGSMSDLANGLDLSCAQVSAAMAMTVAKTEPYYQVYGFSDGRDNGVGSRLFGRYSNLSDLGISPGMDLNSVMRKTRNMTFGGTDLSLPMVWAEVNKVEVDTFLIYTDNETWYGDIHPHKALQKYRQTMGIDAKLVVAGIAATEFSIADPQDAGMMDVVGFDSAAPKVIADFSSDRI